MISQMINEASKVNNKVIALIGCDEKVTSIINSADFGHKLIFSFDSVPSLFTQWDLGQVNIVAIISQSEVLGPEGIALLELIKHKKQTNIPFFLVSQQLSESTAKLALKSGVSDVFKLPIKMENIALRLNILIDHWDVLKQPFKGEDFHKYKTPLIKRVFDIFFAGTALVLLSPLLIIVCILLRLESKGPLFYYALRVGAGYKTFKFYKFRSMFVNADQKLKDLKHLNQYASQIVEEKVETQEYLCDECKAAGTSCRFPMYSDTIRWCEKQYNDNKKARAGSAFFKLKDDPRITKVGKFIRNTSIDELPQLWNVIIGDMSIVGNRPLPLYEAEKLTTDKYAMRFMAPAGITGLWQVEKRGKGEMSEEERLMLDNKYAQNHSFANDIKLILRTIPALFQSETV
jgi:lipopolysaccharide/colanic/teichoic acid biosynthesis glycosyltransferase